MTWLPKALQEKNLSYGAFARLCDISPSSVSKIISGKMRPSADMCINMAAALTETPEKVLRLAGYLDALTDDDPATVEGTELLRGLDEDTRAIALDILRTLYRRKQDSDDD